MVFFRIQKVGVVVFFYEYRRWVWWFLLIQKVGVVVFINTEGGCGGFY